MREGIPLDDIMEESQGHHCWGNPLISKALVSTKSIHVHKGAKNEDFQCSDTLDTCIDDQC